MSNAVRIQVLKDNSNAKQFKQHEKMDLNIVFKSVYIMFEEDLVIQLNTCTVHVFICLKSKCVKILKSVK